MEGIYHYKKANFIKSITDMNQAPTPRLSEVLFVGKSNVGKSSLINALTNNKKLAYTSSKPGMTRLLNYFLIDDKFYFVDAPGYGYSSKKDLDYEMYGKMIDSYFHNNEYLKLAVFLLDSRHEPNEDDLLFYEYLMYNKIPFIFALTKVDKLNMSMKAKIKKNLVAKFKDFDENKLFLVSINNYRLLEKLKDKIDSVI